MRRFAEVVHFIWVWLNYACDIIITGHSGAKLTGGVVSII
jgi:hypothetical protein